MKIGFYDSGLGGLTILKAVSRKLPDYDYVYYGDTAVLPLGAKSESQVYEAVKKGVEYLFEHDCSLVVIACNTASCETLRKLQDTFLPTAYPERRILGVIIPTVESLVESSTKRALLIGTKRTICSGKYHLELGKRGVDTVKIQAVATPDLVTYIESRDTASAVAYVKNIVAQEGEGVDALILGCTHYDLIKHELRSHYKDTLRVISQDEIIPNKLKQYLDVHAEIESGLTRGSTRVIHLTKHRKDYDELLAHILEGQFVPNG